MKANGQAGKSGALLITLVVAMTLLGALGAAVISLTTSSTYTELLANSPQRAYYLAESGYYFARQYIRDNPSAGWPSGTYTLADGSGSFDLSISTNGPLMLIQSTGRVNPGTGIESVRRIIYEVVPSTEGNGEVEISFDEDNDGELDDTWYVGSGRADIVDTGPSDKEPALLMVGYEVDVYLNWMSDPDNPFPDLLAAWYNNGGLLTYDMQVKCKVLDQGEHADHYLVGMRWRLDRSADDYYALGYFKSTPGDLESQTPPWVDNLSSDFIALQDGNVYVVLWKSESGTWSIIDYDQVVADDGVIEEGDLKKWSTLLVRCEELFSGADDSRENHISCWFQGTGVYPRDGELQWQESGIFSAVDWHNNAVQPILDTTFTTENFTSERPEELGVFVYFDKASSQKQFLDDFALRITGLEGGGGSGSQQQY
jgi:hypothetical protein